MVIAVIVIFFASAALVDFPDIKRTGERREVWLYALCLLSGFVVVVLRGLDIPLPSPTNLITEAIRALSLI